MHSVADVDELGGSLLVHAGRLDIGDPELGCLSLGAVSRAAVHVDIKGGDGYSWTVRERESREGDY